jgi:ERCC4-type nuclease
LVGGWLLVYAARQVVRQREVVFVAVSGRARTLWRQRLRVLLAVPGVGPHRARLFLVHFGSIEAVVLAGLEELTDIRGIGSPTAGRIREVVADVTVGVCSAESLIDACNQALVL